MITKEEDSFFPKLKLKLLKGNLIEEKFLTIVASGLINSKRRALDGVTFFGFRNMGQVDQLIDYEINIENSLKNQIYSTIVFMIYFKKDEAKYYIRDYQKKQLDFGLPSILIKIDKPYVSSGYLWVNQYIKSKEHFILNESSFLVIPQNGYLEVIQQASRYSSSIQTFHFLVKDNKNVLIGRDPSCNIKLNWDKTYSKFQASIVWDDLMEQWYIADGKDEVGSRNGTWIYASKSIEIYDNLILKIGSNIMKIEMGIDKGNYKCLIDINNDDCSDD